VTNELLSPELLPLIEARTPRYTSYPTAPVWSADVRTEDFDRCIEQVQAPAAVYVHLPFCAEQCSFCACNQVVAGRRQAGERYIAALETQIRGLALPQDPLPVQRIHLGGGTPTWHTVDELGRIFALLRERFELLPGADFDVEADPEITTDEQVDALASLGATRISMGVQSFDAGVLEAVGRPQRAERIGAILSRARSHGMRGLNIDLMYGLPRQGPEVFSRDLDQVIELRPDRLAIFGYAHVPWLKPHQKRLEAFGLTDTQTRLTLFLMAHQRLMAAGYWAIGFDHFALPGDEMAVAAREGRLHRNFMGYTTRPDVELIGLGTSAISEFQTGYFQQTANLAHWWKAIEQGKPTLEKGILLSADDRMRQDLIRSLMCNLRLDWQALATRWGIDPLVDLAVDLERLRPMQEQGLVEIDQAGLRVTTGGRLLVRNIASAFDAWLHRPGVEAGPRFSVAV